jgi:hypothetical protein
MMCASGYPYVQKNNKTSLNSNADTKGSRWENLNWIQMAHYKVTLAGFYEHGTRLLWVP